MLVSRQLRRQNFDRYPGIDTIGFRISVDGGPWVLIAPCSMTHNPYNTVIAISLNPFSGEPAFSGIGGSLRQYMPAFAVLADHKVVECDNQPCVSLDILSETQQAIFLKEHQDPFTNPKLDRLLTEMPARRFVVFGLPLDTSLRALVLGLIRRNRRVALVQDAVGYVNASAADHVLRQLGVKGCELLTTESFVRSTAARLLRDHYRRVRRSVA